MSCSSQVVNLNLIIIIIIIIIMCIYHALINTLIHINLNTIFYTQVEHRPTKTIYIKHTHTSHRHTHKYTVTVAETGY